MVCEVYSKCNRRGDNTVECVCPSCSLDDPYQPVCGNDGKTHASGCELKRAACNQMKNIKIVDGKACGKLDQINFSNFI